MKKMGLIIMGALLSVILIGIFINSNSGIPTSTSSTVAPETPTPIPSSSITSIPIQTSRPPQTNYTEYYNNSLRYFANIESCYSKAMTELKSGNTPASTATIGECQIIVTKANNEIDKISGPNLYCLDCTYPLIRVHSNLKSALEIYSGGINSLKIVGPLNDYPGVAQNVKDAVIAQARTYVEGAKREWEVVQNNN